MSDYKDYIKEKTVYNKEKPNIVTVNLKVKLYISGDDKVFKPTNASIGSLLNKAKKLCEQNLKKMENKTIAIDIIENNPY